MTRDLTPEDKARPARTKTKKNKSTEQATSEVVHQHDPQSQPTAFDVEPENGRQSAEKEKISVVTSAANILISNEKFINFRGRSMIMEHRPFNHFVPLTRERFDKFAYPILGGVTRARMSDTLAFLANVCEDYTGNDHYMLFGLDVADTDEFYYQEAKTLVWDSRTLQFTTSPDSPSDPFNNDPMPLEAEQAIWRSPYGVVNPKVRRPVPFVMSLAGNDSGLYDDIMQSLAPLVMDKKPDGVIWWVGDGANGKSTLMDAIYRIFPGQLASLTVKGLVDGRDAPMLNGVLANVVKESSEGRVDDTERYKAIGTHEGFRVHKFHSQDDILIRGNLHHIFSANSVPIFNDKGWSARRRTFVVPFKQVFQSDPTFEERTFTPEFFGELIMEMCRYARKLRDQGYRYKWSAQTLGAKEEYDTEANNAEEYGRELINEGVVAFESFRPLRIDYENWCADNGYTPLGATNLRKAMYALSFERISVRTDIDGPSTVKMYRLGAVSSNAPLQTFKISRPGLYTAEGFTSDTTPTTVVPENFPEDNFETPEEPQRESILKGRW